jgi:hypothetical protein
MEFVAISHPALVAETLDLRRQIEFGVVVAVIEKAELASPRRDCGLESVEAARGVPHLMKPGAPGAEASSRASRSSISASSIALATFPSSDESASFRLVESGR